MSFRLVPRVLVVGALLILPFSGFAQEATLSGTVTDTTGGVLPGVTLTAVHEASGNTFEGVTDERGVFRIGTRTGIYRLTATLAGFSTVARSGVELLVGQQVVVNLQLSPAGVQESATPADRSDSPFLDRSNSDGFECFWRFERFRIAVSC